jgi:hypothetical protein
MPKMSGVWLTSVNRCARAIFNPWARVTVSHALTLMSQPLVEILGGEELLRPIQNGLIAAFWRALRTSPMTRRLSRPSLPPHTSGTGDPYIVGSRRQLGALLAARPLCVNHPVSELPVDVRRQRLTQPRPSTAPSFVRRLGSARGVRAVVAEGRLSPWDPAQPPRTGASQ